MSDKVRKVVGQSEDLVKLENLSNQTDSLREKSRLLKSHPEEFNFILTWTREYVEQLSKLIAQYTGVKLHSSVQTRITAIYVDLMEIFDCLARSCSERQDLCMHSEIVKEKAEFYDVYTDLLVSLVKTNPGFPEEHRSHDLITSAIKEKASR